MIDRGSATIPAPIFILGVHKSGTSLLRNLLDGHPSIHAVPIEAHFPHCMGLTTAYPRRRQLTPGATGKDEVIARMTEVIQGYDVSSSTTADAYLPGRFDLDVFRSYLQDHLTKERTADDLWHYVDAISVSIGEPRSDPSKRIVEKSVDNIEHAWWLKWLYPDAKFLFIIRDPYANLVSFRKYIASKSTYPSLVEPVSTLEFGMRHAVLYQRSLPDMLLVKYEALLDRPEEVMRNVLGHLGLSWDPIVLKPTTLGQEWKGNSSSGRRHQGVSADQKDNWKNEIHPIEIDLIGRSAVGKLMGQFGYDTLRTNRVFKPVAHEGLKTFLRNRLYRLFADGS